MVLIFNGCHKIIIVKSRDPSITFLGFDSVGTKELQESGNQTSKISVKIPTVSKHVMKPTFCVFKGNKSVSLTFLFCFDNRIKIQQFLNLLLAIS